MSVTAYPTLRLKLTMPQALKLQFLPAIPGTNAAASAAAAQASAGAAQTAANTAVAATANKVDKSGDVMSGFLTLNADPTAVLHAATKQYVDAHSGGGGGGGAPTTAEYITASADATLTAERVLTNTASITWDFTTPGQAKANTAAGGGNVSNSGTPTAGQYGKWVTATTIQGVAAATVLTDIGALSTTVAASTYQPLDADLTSLAGATATNAIYYRSTANTWATVTVGTGLTFTAGTLDRAALTGDVTASAGTNATTIANDAVSYAKMQNVSAASVLLGRGSAAGAGDPQEIALGTNLSMSGTTLNATGGGGTGVQVGFSAHRNGVNQTPFLSGTSTDKIMFGTEVYDNGSYYDVTLSRWTPPAGIVHIDAAAFITGLVASSAYTILVYKNGVSFKAAWALSTPGFIGTFQVSADDIASGTDYYEIYVDGPPAGAALVNGTSTVTYFEGHVTGGPQGLTGPSGAVTGAFGPPQGRLTLQSGVPVMTTTQAAKTTIWYTAYVGNMVPIYDGTNFAMLSIGSQIGVATTDTTQNAAAIGASQVHDWYVWLRSGVPVLSHGPAWTSDTSRTPATATPVMVNGILLNAATIGNGTTTGPAAQRGTYVGTTRSNASSQIDWIYGGSGAGGVRGVHYVWNMYNRRPMRSQVNDTTTSEAYGTLTWKMFLGGANNAVDFVSGLAEDVWRATGVSYVFTSTSSGGTGIGYDTATTPMDGPWGTVGNANMAMTFGSDVSLGKHTVNFIEIGNTGCVFYGSITAGNAIRDGFIFEFMM